MKTTLVELAYKLMENNKADKLQIIIIEEGEI